MQLLSLVIGALLACWPRSWLVPALAAHGPAGGTLRCLPCFSGRTALALVAQGFPADRRTLLLPAYLCNVVAMAFERHGWKLVGYEVDDRFQPDPTALLQAAAACGASALLLAPLYGSDGGLRWWVSDEATSQRQRLGLALVLDLCQDAAWLAELPAGWRHGAVVVSFNDKSFPGAMGAALWTDLPCAEPAPPGWAVALRLVVWRLRVLVAVRPRVPAAASGFEYSLATHFPHDFAVAGASRWQLALGLLGLRWLPLWQRRRRAALRQGRVRAAGPSVDSTSPFVVVASDDPGLHRRKPAYAQHEAPSCSLRPGLQVRHNKGFADR